MLEILSITGPIYLALLTGYLTTRAGWFTKTDMRVFGKFVIQVAMPALLLNALSQRSIGDILHTDYLLAYAVACVTMLAGAFAWSRWGARRSMSLSSVFAMGQGCSNSGFVGYPIVMFTLGSSVAGVGLALNMLVETLLLIPVLLVLSGMDGQAKGQWRQTLLQTLIGLLRNPMIIAILAGFLISVLGWKLPNALSRTVNLFAQASGAISLFVIGGNLVGQQVKGMFAQVTQIAVGKLVWHPLVMLGVLIWVVPVSDPALRTAALVSCAVPMFSIYAIFSQRYGHEGIASAALLVTTVASFVTLSGLLWGLHQVPGWLG